MEVGNKTATFYGDLVEATISKDMIHMIKLINMLNEEELSILNFALLKIAVVSDAVIKVRKDAN